MADCYRGVVIDGLETIFSNNAVNTLNALLRALNNRKYLYAVTLRLTFEALKERERKEMEEKGTPAARGREVRVKGRREQKQRAGRHTRGKS